MCRYKPRGIFEAYPCTIYCNQWLPQSSISVETKLVNCAEVPRVSVKSNPDRISMETQTQGDCLVQCSMFPIPYSGRRFGGFWNQEEEQIGPVFTHVDPLSLTHLIFHTTFPLWVCCMQGGYDGRGQRSCKCNYVDFYKDARPPCWLLQRCPAPMLTQLGLWLASWLS